ncbi:MAG TPA: hypothetical protein VKY74_20635 [Chloroflexia bacterium]|nr:hypothetical protein [Chloroflexia bacterium]
MQACSMAGAMGESRAPPDCRGRWLAAGDALGQVLDAYFAQSKRRLSGAEQEEWRGRLLTAAAAEEAAWQQLQVAPAGPASTHLAL